MGNNWIDLVEEGVKNGKAKKITIPLKIIDKPVYYLFTSKKDGDIAVSKYPSIKRKMPSKKRRKYYDTEEINKDMEINDTSYDPYYDDFESIIYDDADPFNYENIENNNYAQITDGKRHTAQTHYFLKIYDRSNIMRFLYYLNNHKGLYKEIKKSVEKTLYFDKHDFIVFFSLDKIKYPPKNIRPQQNIEPPCIFPVIKYRYKDKVSHKIRIIDGKYKTMRELLEAEGNTEKIERLENHKKSSKEYRERQAKKEDKERAELDKERIEQGLKERKYRKRRTYNRPE
ncbi:hypothetical protein FACS1894147_10990 [Spirochaetia bacterium]|nr:hypothetical protein FACS1894147_10990 [Spirochaetia bacterium]